MLSLCSIHHMPTRKRVIPRKPEVGAELDPVVEEYLQNRSMRERSEFHESRIKRELLQLLEVAGEPVEAHKQTLTLDVPLAYTQYKNGKAIPKKVVGIERRERVANRIDEDKALALLAKKKLTAECTTTITVLDEDALVAANYAGKITDEELAALYTEHITPAFYLTEDSES